MARKGQENLVPISERTKDEQREMTRNGGRASGKARRKKAATNRLIQQALSMKPVVNENTLESLRRMGYDTEIDGIPTLETIMLLNVIKAATDGDLQAIRLLYEYGHIPSMKDAVERERIAATTNVNITSGSFDALNAAFEAMKGGEGE